MVIAGTGLIMGAALWLLSVFLGWLPMEAASVAWHTGLRAIGGMAVAGCMLAAIGSWAEESPERK